MVSNLRKLIIVLIACVFIISTTQVIDKKQNVCKDKKGEKIQVSAAALKAEKDTLQNIYNKQKINQKKTYQDALLQRELFEQKYINSARSQNSQKKYKIPQRTHSGQHYHSEGPKKRLLTSTNNQYTEINQGNSDQVTDGNYVYSLRYQNLTIHKVQGARLTLISSIVYSSPYYPTQIHASKGYFAVIFHQYNPNGTVVKIYSNSGSSVTEIRQYKTQAQYDGSRQYNSYILILAQKQMKSATIDYWWTVDGVKVNSKVYNGISANKTANNLGNAVRLYAKIYMGPQKIQNYRFATYLFCDFAWNMILTPDLNVITAGNHYNSSGYAASFQTFSFYQKSGQTWGSSKWAVLPGIINSNYQMHQFNNYFRVVLLYTQGQLGTKGHISIAKIPMSSFDPKQGAIYHQLGIEGQMFVASRWRKDAAILIFADGTLNTFSSSFGIFMNSIKVNKKILYIYPYGPNDMIGFGTTQSGNDVALVRFNVNGYKITYKQSISLKSSAFSYSQEGWFSSQFSQFNWKTKLITFPIFSSQNQPYKSGYYQIYANPLTDCLSSLPVPYPCPTNQQNQALVAGKTFKHWDNSVGYDWNSGQSQQIRRISTIQSNGQTILITGSTCQIQARLIKSPYQAPLHTSIGSSQISFYDLCE